MTEQVETAGQQGVSDRAKQIAERLGLAGKPAESEGSSVNGSTQAPEQLEVDVGGAKRAVPVAELVDAWSRRNEVARDREALQRQLAGLGDIDTARKLRDAVAALPPERRQQVFSLLSGEQPDQRDDPDPAEPSRVDGALASRLERLEQALDVLAQRETGRIQQERQQTTEQRVDQLMKSYPVFVSGPEGARQFARDAIMAQVAAEVARGNQGDIEPFVQKAAAKLQELLASQQAAAREDLGLPVTKDKPPPAALTGRGLLSGQTRSAVAQRLMSMFGKVQPR